MANRSPMHVTNFDESSTSVSTPTRSPFTPASLKVLAGVLAVSGACVGSFYAGTNWSPPRAPVPQTNSMAHVDPTFVQAESFSPWAPSNWGAAEFQEEKALEAEEEQGYDDYDTFCIACSQHAEDRGWNYMWGWGECICHEGWHGACCNIPSTRPCGVGITCSQKEANGMSFDCREAGTPNKDKSVVMVHGFPEWSEMYAGLMRSLADDGYHSIACNMRGYSVNARPSLESDYLYDKIASDVTALAEAFGMEQYHLIGHDHGACLSWYVAAEDAKLAVPRLKSLTALSVPHLDAFSDGLYGPNADREQQIASQYFTVFNLWDSASIKFNALYIAMALPLLNSDNGFPDSAFKSPSQFQKALWWYNGAFPGTGIGGLAEVPTLSRQTLLDEGSWMSGFRSVYPAEDSPGAPASNRIGNINAPTLYICGADDFAILCTKEYSLNSKNFINDGVDYEFLTVEECGHDILKCKSDESTAQVIAAITRLLDANS